MDAKQVVAFATSAALVLAGCATSSKDLSATYVSPNQYNSYDCEQLAAEAGRIQTRVVQLGGRLDQAAQNDAGIMAVGLILFWPVLFALGGTKQQEAEYSRLKGEYDAVSQAAIIKKCATSSPPGTASAAPPNPVAVTATTPIANASTATAMVAATNSDAPAALTPAVLVAQQPAKAEVPSPSPVQVGAAAPGVSKFLFNAERFSKGNGCVGATATMTLRTPTYETFAVACTGAEPRIIRCEEAICREMR